MTIREQAERGIALREKAGDYELWLPKQNVPFIKYAFHTYRPLAEAYLAALKDIKELREQVAAQESKEVCNSPHSDDVIDGCPYCRYEALRQRYEKLWALGRSMLDAYHGDDDLGPAFEALDDALAADEGEVEPPDGQY